jgi:protoporphyrinogen oxidase
VSSATTRQAHIAVVGGGFTGLVCAQTLLKAGYQVTVFESQKSLGGLTTSFDFGPFRWDKFYHCILTSDSALIGLLEELELASELRWTSTEVGLYSHGALHKMSGPRDLMRFPHMSLMNKARLAFGTLYASHITNGERLEEVPLSTWTRRVFGDEVYREMWEPLFRCKLGEMRHHASAAFLWGTLRRLYSTRQKGPAKQERLGYVHGGYDRVFSGLCSRVLDLGATLRTGDRIDTIRAKGPHTPGSSIVEVVANERAYQFDGAILTLPNQVISACLETDDAAYVKRLLQVNYLGLVCVVVLLKRKLSPYYVTNITDASPFTGVIEMTNLVDRDVETAGLHLVYLPRYTSTADPVFGMEDDEIWRLFEAELRRMHPDISADDIVSHFVFKQRTVQPVPTLGYSRIAPPVESPVKGVYVANTAQIINNTLNNNVMTTLAKDACARLQGDISPQLQVEIPKEHLCNPLPWSSGTLHSSSLLARDCWKPDLL